MKYYEEDNSFFDYFKLYINNILHESVLDYNRTQLIILTSLNRPKRVGDFVPDIRWNFQSIKNYLKRSSLTWEP